MKTTVLAMAMLLVTSAMVDAQTPPRDAAATGVGTAVIRGRVVDAATGDGLRGVSVAADASGDRQYAITDGDGRYEIANLPAGRYRVSAASRGYLTLDLGQTRPAQAGKPLVVANRQTVDNVNFALPFGGSIAGTVRDNNGEPVANAQVRALHPIYREGRKVLYADLIATTNDLGAYRLYGLTSGSFYLSILAPVTGATASGFIENNGAGLAPTYFPGTPNLSEARRVTVKLGETQNNIDVTVLPVNNGAIRVSVVDGEQRPLVNPQVGLTQVGPGLLYASSARPQPDGSPVGQNLAPGDYEVRVTATASNAERTPLIAVSRAVVVEGQTTELRLAVAKTPSASGRLVIDPAVGSTFSVARVQLFADPGMVPGAVPYQARPGARSGIPIRVQPDLRFTFTVPLDRATIVADALPSGWYLKRVLWNGVDVSDGIQFPAGGEVSGIEVELTNHPSEISGAVTDQNGRPADDFAVVVFAQDPARRLGLTRYFAMTRPDDGSGAFKVLGLPPGDYFAIALEYADPEVSADPDFLEPLARNATPFSLVEGAPKTLDLKLVK